MSKIELYEKYGEKIRDEFKKAGVELSGPASRRLCGYITNLVEEVRKPKATSGKTHGAEIWATYSQEFERRYGAQPVRNAQTNGQAKKLAERVGLDDGKKLVKWYVWQNDAFYVRNCHSLGLCLKDAESLWTKMKTGQRYSRRQADKVERTSTNADAIGNYIRKKNGDSATL